MVLFLFCVQERELEKALAWPPTDHHDHDDHDDDDDLGIPTSVLSEIGGAYPPPQKVHQVDPPPAKNWGVA